MTDFRVQMKYYILLLPLLSVGSLRASAQIVCGDLVDLLNAADNCRQAGDVTLSEGSTLTNVNLKGIQTITGDLDLLDPDLESLQAPSLETITGNFTLRSSLLSELGISGLKNLTGDLYFELGQSPLDTISMDLVALSDNSDFSFLNSPNVQRIRISSNPQSAEGNRSLILDQNFALNTLDVQGVAFRTVNISAASLTSIPDIWTETANYIKLYSLGLLGSISIPAKEASSDIAIAGIGSPTLDFPNLNTVGGSFNLIQTETETLLVPELTTVSDEFVISINSKLQKLVTPKLKSVSVLAFANNSFIGSLSFTALSTVNVLSIQHNDYMNNLDLAAWFPALLEVTGYIVMSGQITNVTFPNMQGGNGIKAPSITITSSVDLDCESVKNEAVAKQAIININNLRCTPGPQGTKPTFTASPPPLLSTASATDSSTTGQNNGNRDSSSALHVGAIVGGALGGVVLLVAIIGTIWYFKRRNLVRPNSPSPSGAGGKVGGIEDDLGGIEDGSHGAGGILSK